MNIFYISGLCAIINTPRKASLRCRMYRYGRCRPKSQRSQIVLRNDRGSAHAIFRAETAFPPKAPFRSPREHKTERKRPFWAAPAIRRRFSGNSFAENLYNNHLGATQKQGFCGEVLRIPPLEPRNAPLLGLRPAARASCFAQTYAWSLFVVYTLHKIYPPGR